MSHPAAVAMDRNPKRFVSPDLWQRLDVVPPPAAVAPGVQKDFSRLSPIPKQLPPNTKPQLKAVAKVRALVPTIVPKARPLRPVVPSVDSDAAAPVVSSAVSSSDVIVIDPDPGPEVVPVVESDSVPVVDSDAAAPVDEYDLGRELQWPAQLKRRRRRVDHEAHDGMTYEGTVVTMGET